MDTTIGVSQTSLANASVATTSLTDYYVARFVSKKLDQTSISANTWTWNFAAALSNAAANFPVSGGNQPVYVNLYVWKTSNGTKTATILDGDTASVYDEPGGNNSERVMHGTFSGAAASSLTAGDDCLVLEVWFRVTQAMGNSYTQTFYYDGTTENTTENATVSNHASFLETPETIAFVTSTNFDRPLSDTVSVSDGLDRVVGFPRGVSDTTTSDDSVATAVTNTRTLSDTVTSSEDLARSVTNVRTLEDTTGSSDDLQRIVGFPRALVESAISVVDDLVKAITNTRTAEETTPVSDDLQRQLGAARTITESSVTSDDSVSTVRGLTRAITEGAISVGDQLDRLLGAIRELPESVSSDDSVDTDVFNTRVLSDTTVVGDQLDRTYGANRELQETVSSGDSVSISQTITRIITEAAVSVGDQLDRLYGALRTLGDTTTVDDSVDAFVTPGGGQNFDREVSDTVGVSDQLDRTLDNQRNLSDTTGTSDQLDRSITNARTLSDNVPVTDDVSRSVTLTRVITEAGIAVNDQVDRLYSAVRNLIDEVLASDTVTRAITITRELIENVPIFDSLLATIQGQINVGTTDISIILTNWLSDNWTDDPVSTVEHHLIPPKSKITFGSRFDLAAGTHSDMHVHVRNVSHGIDQLSTDATVEENSVIASIYAEVRYIPDTPPDFSGTDAGAPSDMMWQIRSYITELIRADPEQLYDTYGIEVISILQEIPDANTPVDVHAQNVIENLYTIIIRVRCFYTLKVNRLV